MSTIRTHGCGGRMDYMYFDGVMVFTCQMCGATETGGDMDRNRRSGGSTDVSGIQRRKLLKYADTCPENPIKMLSCTECNHDLAVFIETPHTKKRYYKCKGCGHESQ